MCIQSHAVLVSVLYILGALLLLVGVGMIIGSQCLEKYPREGRTLARYGVVFFIFGIVGIVWLPFLVFLISILFIFGVVKSCLPLKQ